MRRRRHRAGYPLFKVVRCAAALHGHAAARRRKCLELAKRPGFCARIAGEHSLLASTCKTSGVRELEYTPRGPRQQEGRGEYDWQRERC